VYAIAKPLANRGVHPDSISYFTLLLALISSLSLVLFVYQPLFGILVFITGLFDGVDGAVAKLRSSSSEAGALTDSLIDRVAELTLTIGIMLTFQAELIIGLSVSAWAMLCIASWLLTSYTRARAESLGVQDLDIGLGARSERLLTLVVFALLSLLLWGLVIVTLMGLCTAAYRYYHYKRELSSKTK
jgi:archaetidylinositol phosphate synthase